MWFRKAKKKREYKRTFTEDEIRDAEIPSATEKLAQKSLADWVEAMREASWGGLNDRFAEGGEVTDFNLNEAVFLGEPAGGFPEDRETAVGRARANKDPNHVHEWVNVDYRDGSYFYECWCLSKKTDSLPPHQDVAMTIEQANAKADVAYELQKGKTDHVHAWFVVRQEDQHFVHSCWCGSLKRTSIGEKQILRYVGVDKALEIMYEPLPKPTVSSLLAPDQEWGDVEGTDLQVSQLKQPLVDAGVFNNPGVIVGDPTPVLTIQDARPRASDGRLFWGCKHHRYQLTKVENDIMYFSCKDCVEFYTTPRWHWRALLKGQVRL